MPLALGGLGYGAARSAARRRTSPQPAGEVTPSPGAMADAGLWLELALVTGFTVGLGLGSLRGQPAARAPGPGQRVGDRRARCAP